MSKVYLLFISVLALTILGIGVFAYTRSSTSKQPPAPVYQSPTPAPTTPTKPVTATPPATPLQNQITLTVSSPKNGQEVSSATITVSGKTVAAADVSVNEKDLKADASGNFSTTITLDEGDNEIFVTASDAAGNSSDWTATVTYAPTQ